MGDIRENYSHVNWEPLHPDITSGFSWPQLEVEKVDDCYIASSANILADQNIERSLT